jgi:hypothetical protein
MADHAGRRGFAVRSGDRQDRDAGGRPAGKQHVEDGTRDVARAPFRRLKMHAEAGGGIHLHDPAAGLVHGS